jgi:hypothetical protein
MVAVPDNTKPQAITKRNDPRLLTGMQSLLLPLLLMVLRGEKRRILLDRRDYTKERRQRSADAAKLRQKIEAESHLYEKIIIETLARLRFKWVERSRDGGYYQDGKPRRRRRRKIQKVRFELVRFNQYAIYYKIHTRSKRLFGKARSELPDGVYVRDLICDDTVQELSIACQRTVKAKSDDHTKGAWLVLYRTSWGGALPKFLGYTDTLKYYPSDMSALPFILGLGENNRVCSVDFDAFPHCLIAGASGSGKSNILNCFLSSLVRMTTPEQVKLYLIDPKQVELRVYEKAPHLAAPIISGDDLGERTIEVLEACNQIINERTRLMADSFPVCKKLSQYNKRHPDAPLPRIVIVVEEMQSLWETSKQAAQIKRLLTRISAMGRAPGVHLILCTQMPNKRTIPIELKVNLWTKICGRVGSTIESQVVLTTGEAAYIPDIKGRMIYAVDAYKNEIQTPFIEDEDIYISIAIARGREAGMVKYEALKLVFTVDAIAEWIADHREPITNIPHLQKKLTGYAVPGEIVSELIHKIRDEEGYTTAAGRVFIIVNGYLREIKPDRRQHYPEIAAPIIAGLLPAPVIPEPPPAPMPQRKCPRCGVMFTPTASHQKYHDDNCRKLAHRERKKAQQQ